MRACVTTGFPVTIVRPSHTYDEATPPIPGDWTVIDRIARGAIVAGALGVEPRIVHIASEDILAGAPDWFWSELIIGDLSHSAVFDNSKVRRYVPDFARRLTFHAAAPDMIRWRAGHAEQCRPAPDVDAIMDRLVGGYHSAREIFTALGAAAHGTRQPDD